MNYTFTKQYGKIVRKMAAEFNKGRDIFEAASALDKYAKYNFAYSRYAYRELYGRFYPDNQKAVTYVIDRYVMSNEVATAFLENLYVDQDEEIEFIKREIGDVYSLLRQIQNLLQGMAITAHPEDGSEELYHFTMNNIVKKVVNEAIENEEEIDSFMTSTKLEFDHLFSEQLEESHDAIIRDEPEGIMAGDLKQEKQELPHRVEQVMDNTESPHFQIKDEHQCATVYKFLKTTAAIDKDNSFTDFLDAIGRADMSKIIPGTITKFRSAVARMKWVVKGDVDLWSKLACQSIGKTPSQAASNSTNTGKWFEDLCEIIPEGTIIK